MTDYPSYLDYLTLKELKELTTLSIEELESVIRIMYMQIRAPFFIGDRERSQAVFDAATVELFKRKNQ